MRAWVLFVTAAVACTGDSTDAGTCNQSAAPVVVDLRCQNTGIQPDGDNDAPTLTLTAVAQDRDGDLGRYTAEIFFDDVLDGALDNATSLGILSGGDGSACGVTEVGFETTIFLRGGQPLFETTYEWGVIVTDANGNVGPAGIQVCATPDEQGQ